MIYGTHRIDGETDGQGQKKSCECPPTGTPCEKKIISGCHQKEPPGPYLITAEIAEIAEPNTVSSAALVPPGSPASQDPAVDYTSVQWVAEQHRLGWKLISALQQNERLRKGIWIGNGERTTGDKKIIVCGELARLVLADEAPYKEVYEKAAAAGKKEEAAVFKHYAKAVKLKVRNLELLYAKKLKKYGATGAGLADSSEITPGSPLDSLWSM
jgi:hypothetical protein